MRINQGYKTILAVAGTKCRHSLAAFVLGFSMLSASAAGAQEYSPQQEDESEEQAEGDREPAADAIGRMAAGKMKRARYRQYPGGQDEQEITVQALLPVPTR